MTMKSDAKFEEKLTVGFKNDMINLVYFDASRGGERWCCHRPQNGNICLPQNTDFLKTVPKARDY